MGGETTSPAGGKVTFLQLPFVERRTAKGRFRHQSGYGKDTLRPVTIKQILDAQQSHPDADFRVDDQEITQVVYLRLQEKTPLMQRA